MHQEFSVNYLGQFHFNSSGAGKECGRVVVELVVAALALVGFDEGWVGSIGCSVVFGVPGYVINLTHF